MKKLLEFRILIHVDDEGEMNPATYQSALEDGLTVAKQEGYLTREDDGTTITESWSVEHVSTTVVEPPELQNPEIVAAIAEMMDNWAKLEGQVRYLCPDATPEEVEQKTRAMMDLAIQTIKERHTQ